MGIDEKINILNNKKPFPKYTQNSLEEDFKLRFKKSDIGPLV